MTPDPPPADRPEGGESNPALRARVPDHVAGGCFSTGVIVMTGPSEFVIDFLQTIGRPHRVASRVIIPHPVMPQFVEALQKNLDLYRGRFGDPPVPPGNPDPEARRPSPQEIYDDLKLPDEVLSGTYANGVMIGHGATEFGLDFLTSFFPQSAVSSRVFLAAGQVPRLLESLKGAVHQLQQRQQRPAAGRPDGATFDPPRPYPGGDDEGGADDEGGGDDGSIGPDAADEDSPRPPGDSPDRGSS